MRLRTCIVALLTAASLPASAASDRTLVVLPLDTTKTAGRMSPEARATLEEQLRDEAANALAGTGWTVMTGETTLKLLTDNGIDPAKCGEGGCHLETAKEMHVGKFISGAVQFAEGYYTASVRLIDTKTGNIHASVRIESDTVRGLRKEFADKAGQFFARSGLLRQREAGPAAKEGRIGEDGRDVQLDAEEVVVKLESDPPGAVVLADGKLLCQATPCAKTLAVGPHEIAMQKEGYDEARIAKRVERGATVSIKLLRADALLAVETTPSGLRVTIDGAEAGKSPIPARSLRPGAHEVLVDDPCFLRAGERVVLAKGAERTVRVEAKPRLGVLKLSAEDDKGNSLEGTAELDGVALGRVPGRFRVPICSKRVSIRSGGGAAERALALREKQVETVRAVVRGGGTSGAQQKLAEEEAEWAEHKAALTLFEQSKFGLALDAWETALARHPSAPVADQARLGLLLAAKELGEAAYPRARPHIPVLMTSPHLSGPQRSTALRAIGVLQLTAKDNKAAAATLSELVVREPMLAEGHYNYACALANLQNPGRALEELAVAFKIDASLAKQAANDEDLKPLRSSPEFQRLVSQAR